MSTSQDHITGATPMGATPVEGGTTFRVWAPSAHHVYVAVGGADGYQPRSADELVKDAGTGHWTGFFAGVEDGTKYRYFVAGPEHSGFKRDPWARELELRGYPNCDCIVRERDRYPWHDRDYLPPPFNDLIVYQLHIGRFYARDGDRDNRPYRVAKFLDALERVEYVAQLGVTAVQPLPVVEFQGEWSLGYNGTDLFSPEMDYCVDDGELERYLKVVNALLAKKEHPPLSADQISGQVDQLKAFIDICHLFGLAVIVDVVYNHAGGGFDAQSIDYFDFPAQPGPDNNLYFSDQSWAGGRVFDYDRPGVRSLLIENAKIFLAEYHVDGLRFDEVTVIDSHGGWSLCQDLTATLHYQCPAAVLIAEYWNDPPYRWKAVAPPPDGMGFDLGYSDGVRDGVRNILAAAAAGANAMVRIGRLRDGLQAPPNMRCTQTYNCLENHDLVLDADGDHRKPRIPRLADPTNPRSWYACSRARVATGVLLTAPGVPMLFMGQEFLEDKLWSDDPRRADLLIWWDGLEGRDPDMVDFHRCTKDLIWLRRRHPALRSDAINVYAAEDDRLLAFHRWIPGLGRDVVVVAGLRESTIYDHGYHLGFPLPGYWHEVFNSDFYDHLPNPWVQGNQGGVVADGPPLHGLPYSARLTLPANSILVFAKDLGDQL